MGLPLVAQANDAGVSLPNILVAFFETNRVVDAVDGIDGMFKSRVPRWVIFLKPEIGTECQCLCYSNSP